MAPRAEDAAVSTGKKSLEYSLISVTVSTARPIRMRESRSISPPMQAAPVISVAVEAQPTDSKIATRKLEQNTARPTRSASRNS